ncbi:MAG TPA: GDP-mannose 4,6-dehydratase [Casimicrobiaceae bacterium]
MPKVLVTGHTGFVGRTLLAEASAGNIGFEWHSTTLPDGFDIRDSALADAIATDPPDAVIHLAALTSVAESFEDLDRYVDVNFHGTRNLLRALRAIRFSGCMLYVGSGDCYGAVSDSDLPVCEDQPLRPRSPYAMSKVAAEALCFQSSLSEPFDIVIARPFNHIGPAQDNRFAVAAFAQQVAEIAAGAREPRLLVGDLDVTRDFTDVRDVIRAYVALLSGGRRGETYNVGSGRETRLADLLQMLLDLAGVRCTIETDPARLRSAEQRRMVADITKITRETNWAPQIALERTLRETLDYWKGKTANA